MWTMNKQHLTDVLLAWFLVLGVLSITDGFLKAGSAFYKQVIKHEPLIQLRLTPDMFLPCEGFDRSRSYCGINKARTPQLPKVETV